MAKFWMFTPSGSNSYRVGAVGVKAAFVVADDADAARAALNSEVADKQLYGMISGEIHTDALDVITELTSGDAVLTKGRIVPSGKAEAIGSEGSH